MTEYLWLNALDLDPEEIAAYVNEQDEPIALLGPLNRLALFVGPNNSGKSRFMRLLFKQAALSVLPNEQTARVFAEALRASRDFVRRAQQVNKWIQFASRGDPIEVGGLERTINSRAKEPTGAASQLPSLQRLRGAQMPDKSGDDNDMLQHLIDALSANGRPLSQQRIYIPALRTAARFQPGPEWPDMAPEGKPDVLEAVARDRFFKRTPHDSKASVLSGLGLYTRLLHHLTGKSGQRASVRRFEEFLSAQFFRGKQIVLIPRCSLDGEERTLHLGIGTDEARALHTLGDGLGSLITLLAPFFLEDEGTRIYIEEPELYLHPGFQRLFVDTILGDSDIIARNVHAVVVTHSNHLVGVATHHPGDIGIFRFRQLGDAKFSIASVQPESLALLDDLGVHNASVLLAGCSIWVEGPSDRDYVRAGLLAYRLHHKESPLMEDLHFSIFEYGGSNIAHYDFARDDAAGDSHERQKLIKQRWLANRVFLLADRDAADHKDQRFDTWDAQAEESGGFLKVARTHGREIENDLAGTVLQKAISQAFKRKGVSADSATFAEDTYRDQPLGTYLDSVLGSGKYSFAGKGGSLKAGDKVALAATVLRLVDDGAIRWTDLSKPFQALMSSIWDFIQANNRLP